MAGLNAYLSLVKFSHTVFALPFAAIGFTIGLHSGAGYPLDLRLLVLVGLCMVTARNAAMAFNRWADRLIDIKNPRTTGREIPSGRISARNALIFTAINAAVFLVSAYQINFVCFVLAPLALAIVLGYSYTKRFSWLCHLFLGLGLSLAPVGAFLAVHGSLEWLPVLYAIAVVSWVAGFDIIYALQDIDFDKSQQLQSIPARFGMKRALWISGILHTLCALAILWAAWLLHRDYGLNDGIYIGSILFIVLLAFQHFVIGRGDLSKVNMAFFTTNGMASITLAAAVILDFYC